MYFNSNYAEDRKISSGIKDIDLILEGGYPHPSAILVKGNAIKEKNILSFNFTKKGLEENDRVIFSCLDFPANELILKLRDFGISQDLLNNLFIIDGSGKLQMKNLNVNLATIPNPGALTDFSLTLKNFLETSENKKIRLVIHTFSSILLHSKLESALEFLEVIKTRLNSANGSVLLILDDHIHDAKTIALVERICEEIIKIDDKENIKEIKFQNIPFSLQIRSTPFSIEVL